ncbi:MAG: hypothetical protein CMP28_14640 [Roseibacillus sp.]|nr:hypothetical protein [Roseibacillus sp.]
MSPTREGFERRWDLAMVALPLLAALGSPLHIAPLPHVFILVTAGLAFALRPRILQQPLLWLLLTGVFGVTICRAPLAVGNHHFLSAYISLATGFILWGRSTQWREQWAGNGRWLLVGVMVFAVVHKLLSPDYLKGDFWGYFLSFGLAGKLIFATGFWEGPVEVFRQNREALSALGGSGLTDGAAASLKEPFAHFRTIALALTWVTLVAEALIALGFLLFRRPTIPHIILLGFVLLLTLIRPEAEFAALLLALGLMTCRTQQVSLRISYGAGITLCLILSLTLQNTGLGVSL